MIVGGHMPPGSRVPSQTDLQAKYSTGTGTVQAALRQLQRDGFIYADGTRGTFVSKHPPHLSAFGVVFPESSDASRSPRSRFWEAIEAQLPGLPTSAERQIKTYYQGGQGISSREGQQLLDDLQNHRLAGLLFVTPPFSFVDTPVLDMPGIPRVAIMDRQLFPGVPAIFPDYQDLLRHCIKRLARAGRRGISLLASGPLPPELETAWPGLLKEHEMVTRESWQHYVLTGIPEAANHLTQLLMECGERPDGLIVLDDNLLPGVSDGLITSNVAPDSLTVVAHCNDPFPTRSEFPVERVSFDTHQLLEDCLEMLEDQQGGDPVPPLTLLGVSDGDEASD
jgi:hypothetical protein